MINIKKHSISVVYVQKHGIEMKSCSKHGKSRVNVQNCGIIMVNINQSIKKQHASTMVNVWNGIYMVYV